MSRRVAIVLGIVVVLASGASLAVWMGTPRDPIARAQAAAERGDWSRVIDQAEMRLKDDEDDPDALILKARGLAHLGRSDDAGETYALAGGQRMTPADLRVLSDLLLSNDREAMAWLALEAANRIDPKDAETRRAMTALHGRVGSRGDIAHTTDRLSSVPTGPALAQLVAELMVLARNDSENDPFLDRVLMRDRETLRTLDTPSAVQRFIARLLLESGRLAEARDRLTKLLDDGPNPEASWLMSRVWLQLGDDSAADRALTNAKNFASDHRAEHDPAVYVGAKSCRSCHAEIYDQQQNSRHAGTIYHGADMAQVKIPDGPIKDPVNPDVTHEFTRAGDTVKLATTVADKTYRAILDYAIGSGHHGVTMIGKDGQGDYRELRVSEYSENGTVWDVTSGFSPHPGVPSEYLGKGLSSAGFRDCIHCHTTRFRGPDAEKGPESADRGIGCERCHGPGGNHVKAVETGFAEVAIGRPKGASGPERMKICAECHASDGTFPPTDPQFVRFQSSTLTNSRCFTESMGKLDCVTCHDPHKNLETSANFYEAKCLSCHSTMDDDSHRVTCPVSPRTNCLSCHMPRIPEVVPHTSLTDHHIRIHREEARDEAPATAQAGASRARIVVIGLTVVILAGAALAYVSFRNGGSRALADVARREVEARNFAAARTAIAKWIAADPSSGEAYFQLARVEVAQENDQKALDALGAAVEKGYPPAELAPYFAVVQSHSQNYDQAEPILRLALSETDEPMPDVAQALARLYLSTFRLQAAAQPIARWMKDAPDDPRPYLYRNEIDTRSNADHSVIIQNYKAALDRDPNLAKARLGLADRLRQANRLDEAAAEFERYIQLKPDDPEGYVGAGRTALLQARTGAAAKFFDRALELNPNEPVALKERGVIDLKDRQYESARDRLRKVLEFDPYDPDTHYNLARALQRTGDDAGARAEDALAQTLRAEHIQLADTISALVKKPRDIDLRRKLARWQLDHGRDGEGLTLCDQILKDKPGDLETLDLLIEYHERKKDAGKANYYRLMRKQVNQGSS